MLILKTAKRGLAILGVLFLGLAILVLIRAMIWKGPSWEKPVALAPAVAIDGEAAARRLSEAVRFQTVSHQNPAENDWSQWAAFRGWLAASYPKAHGVLTRDIVAEHTLVYAWPGSDRSLKPIVLMAHQDVVPIVEETRAEWKRAPFSGDIAEGAVWGRGTLDDKASLVALMEAVEGLAARGFQPRRTVYLVFGHDEEVGGTGAAAAADLLARRGVTPEFVLDEGGLALTEDPLNGRPMAMIGTSEKGSATLQVVARGPGGHSSMPPTQTAVHILAKAIDRIASDQFPLTMGGQGADTLRTLAGDGPFLTRAMMANEWLFGSAIAAKAGEDPGVASVLRTSIAPTMLSGSPKENVLPDRATALINYRVHPRDTLPGVMARAKAAVGDLPVTLTWTRGSAGASPEAPTDTPTWFLLARLARDATGAKPMPGLLTGATDGRAMVRLTPNVYRFLPVLLTEAQLETFHGVNEHLTIRNLDRAAEFYARLIATAAR